MKTWLICMGIYFGIFMVFSKEYYRFEKNLSRNGLEEAG